MTSGYTTRAAYAPHMPKRDHSPRPPLRGLERLWAPAPSGERAQRAPLSAERVVAAAIDLADVEGLEAVSMSRLAERLASAPMSLYRHVSNKDELLLLMHDAAWRPPAIPETDDDWRTGLTAWAREQRDVLRRHLWLERIRLSERAGTPSQLTWMEWGLRVLAPTRLGERTQLEVLLLLSGYVLWEARFHAETTVAAQEAGSSVQAVTADFGALIASVTPPDAFPALHRTMAAGAFQADARPPDATFEFGLELVLDGVDRLVAGASSG